MARSHFVCTAADLRLRRARSAKLITRSHGLSLSLQIVPIANLEGRKAVEAGNLCQRTMLSGIQLLCRCDFAWHTLLGDAYAIRQGTLILHDFARGCLMAGLMNHDHSYCSMD